MALDAAKAEIRGLLWKDDRKTPWVPVTIANTVFWPFLLFAYCYVLGISPIRLYYLQAFYVLSGVVGVTVCVVVTLQARELFRNGEKSRGAFSLAIGCWAALAFGPLNADQNYRKYMLSYYTFQDLAMYTDIDPNVDVGQTYMDAGQVYFKEGSTVLVNDLVVYRSQNNYCAAPILSATIWNPGSVAEVEREGALKIPQSGTVDFWAVGTNCCNASSKTFTCGSVSDPRARAGLRLLRDDARPYYMLAVQQWTARLCPMDDNSVRGNSKAAPRTCLPAKHPLFFHWVVDPIQEVDGFYNKSLRLAAMHAGMFAVGSLLLAHVVLWFLFNLGFH